MKCSRFYDLEYIMNSRDIPRCECGGIIKPDVVLYQEGLDNDTIEKAIRYISQAEMLIIGGTSLGVYPAAGLVDYFRGKDLVLINKGATSRSCRASLVIERKIGEVFRNLL